MKCSGKHWKTLFQLFPIIGKNYGERFAFFDRLARLLHPRDTNGVVDRIIRFLPPRAEQKHAPADQIRIDIRNDAVRRSRQRMLNSGFREFPAGGTALRGDHRFKFFKSSSVFQTLENSLSGFSKVWKLSGKFEHVGGQLNGQLAQILRPAAV